MEIINVKTKSKDYHIYLGNDIIPNLSQVLKEREFNNKIYIITDENVYKYHFEDLLFHLKEYEVNYYVVKPGENSKSINSATKIYEELINYGFNRNSLIISFGGGVVGDLAGYVASTFMRGIKFIQIPTTLLSQVDSSIGGKVAINFNGYKNIVGTFYQPDLVTIDIKYLNTLNNKEFISGLGEVIKYGLISDFSFYNYIKENMSKLLNLNKHELIYIINKSVNIKRRIVSQDERDNNIRNILNFGHTIGHGIESLSNFNTYNHGEAVILGMLYESKLALHFKLIHKEYYNEIYSLLSSLIDIKEFDENEIKLILHAISKDKKSINNNLRIILPIGKGKVDIFDNITKDYIEIILKEGLRNEN